MCGRGAPHTPTNGLAVSPGIIRSQASPSPHAYCRHGRHIHLPVPWGRPTSWAAGRQSWATEPARYDAPCNRREPARLHTMAVEGQEGSWGIHQYPFADVQPRRSIATHRKPQLGSGKFGGKRAEIGRPGVVEGVMHGPGGPHAPTNGLAVSPGSRGTQANPSQHVYCLPGRPGRLSVPWGRPTSGTATSHQSRATEPARYDAPCDRRDPQLHLMAVAGSGGSWGIHQDP